MGLSATLLEGLEEVKKIGTAEYEGKDPASILLRVALDLINEKHLTGAYPKFRLNMKSGEECVATMRFIK